LSMFNCLFYAQRVELQVPVLKSEFCQVNLG